MKKENTVKLCKASLLVALSTVLSVITVWKMPLGGSITPFSMLPVIIISCMLGIKWGLISSFIYSVIQLTIGIATDGILGWGLTTICLIGTFLFDYIVPFTFLGFAGMFKAKGLKGIYIGTIAVVVFRFLCHVVSGAIIFDTWSAWDNAWIYSVCYNGAFMLPELIMTVVGMFAVTKVKVISEMMGIEK